MIRQIVAFDTRRGIAKDGVQPWKLPADEAYFSAMTKTYGGVILMGNTTFEVIGQPLSDRQNFVATRTPDFVAEGVTPVYDLDAFLDQCRDVWVIGGAAIYAATLRRTDELYVTHIDADFECDVFFPEFLNQFQLQQQGEPQHQNGLDYRYDIYQRRP